MTDILVEQIKLLPIPEDTEKNNRTWLAPLELTGNAKSLPAFIELIDQFMEALSTTGLGVLLSRVAPVTTLHQTPIDQADLHPA